MQIHNLKISRFKWFFLVKELRRRGNNERESGAFLLGKVDNVIISDILYYDDLDPKSLDEGYIRFRGEGYVKLWEYCREKGLMVLADVHTHPGIWTGQSELDRTHPMIAQKGHIALIVPNYAKKLFQFLKGVGIFKYLGSHKWEVISER